ncbi:hypothetical protein COTS27_00924 [Spirochaetota bacterium]|nr:hypothetical protein COTS27_00924 [Spirochaetota bacterium]
MKIRLFHSIQSQLAQQVSNYNLLAFMGIFAVLSLLALPLLQGAEVTAKSNSHEKKAETEIAPHIAKMLKEIETGKAILLDVREQEEWDAGHLELADLVPLSKLKEGYKPKLETSKKRIYLHCRSGNRVNTAKPLLQKKGFKDVVALKEGFNQLRAMGLKATVPSNKQQ